MTGVLIAILSGILMSLQGVFNTQLTRQSSLWSCAAFVQITAFLVCILAWLFSDRSNLLRPFHARPLYLLLGGVLGAFITLTVVLCMQKMGPARAVLLIVTAQIISAYFIEVLGLFDVTKHSVTLREILGIVITIVGVVIFKF